ncbi:MAG: PIN domain nuclease [Desulfobacteraceae bacterium]|nr:MAG: PIN domain nuclease [Desulfobacteraceae bacterium]
MILVDTSVLIDFFRGSSSTAADNFRSILVREMPFGITSFIYQELLQGAGTEKEYRKLKSYLSTQRFYHPLDPVDSYQSAAQIYLKCGKKGISVRSTIDCLIAQITLEHKLILLHNDKDFDAIATIVPLRTWGNRE